MRPKLRLAYFDETEYWAEDIVSHAGRVAGLYVYDANLRVFCCEMTPSREMHLAGYLTEHYIGDAMQMAMLQATEAGSIHYVHCWQVDGFHRIRRRPGFRDIDPFAVTMPCTCALPGPWPRDRDAAITEAMEMLQICGFTTT